MLLGPFTNIPTILILHITASICLFIHWQTNSDTCCLTVLEKKMYGHNHDNKDKISFIERLTSPIYKIDNVLIYAATFILMCISAYKLWINGYKFTEVSDCYAAMNPQEGLLMKFFEIIYCLRPLFNIK